MISVIIPVYNTEIDKLERCISSIIHQTYRDFEIIIIDDGSSGNVIDYLERISNNNSYIKVFFQSHLGVSKARNLGVEKSKGEYIVFVDSDDYIFDDYFESAVRYAEITKADLIIGGIEFEYPDHIDTYMVHENEAGMWLYSGIDKKKIQKQLLSGRNDIESQELAQCLNASPCSKLYSRELALRVKFNPEITIYEDLLYIFQIIQEANKICMVDRVWYKYIQYETSSLHKYNPTLPGSFDYAINHLYRIVNEDEGFISDATVFLIKYIELLFSNYYVRRECESKIRIKISQIRLHLSRDEIISLMNRKKTSKLSLKEKIVYLLVIHKMYFALYFLAKIKCKN